MYPYTNDRKSLVTLFPLAIEDHRVRLPGSDIHTALHQVSVSWS